MSLEVFEKLEAKVQQAIDTITLYANNHSILIANVFSQIFIIFIIKLSEHTLLNE